MKIGFLIPSTSKNRDWQTLNDMYLYNITLKSFLTTYDNEHTNVFYIGIDRGDTFFRDEILNKINRFIGIMKNVEIKFIYFNDNIKPGHLTRMWNVLFKEAYNENCDYFYQCGDDIQFCNKGWVNECIKVLKNNNDIGMTSPIDIRNQLILTQSFVSRKHMEIFGCYFPEEIINWGCDDWINYVYRPKHFFPLNNHFCKNLGGTCRYTVDNNEEFFDNYKKNVYKLRKKISDIVESKYKLTLRRYLLKNNT